MAIKSMTKAAPTGLMKWADELKKQAEAAAAQEAGVGGGQFFSLKAGQLTFGGNPLPNNEMACIILDHITENVYSSAAYSPDTPFNPECYAFGRDDKSMAPHAAAPDPQHGQCFDCEHNQWGSAEKGRGKACKNRRRMALLSAGLLERGELKPAGEPQLTDGTIGYLALPPTSINGYAQYVKSLAGALNRPPRGVYTKIAVVPDAKTQFRVVFSAMGPVPDELLGVVMERAKAVESQIAFPYQPQTETPKPAAKVKRKF